MIQHRDAWQNIGQILDSKANISSYILEVTQQLGMNYQAPHLPVDLKYRQALPEKEAKEEPETFDPEARMKDFRKITHQHNIRLN